MSGRHQLSQSTAKLVHPSSPLKYYIHDSVHALRFQLIGSLVASDIAELSGCWTTAKTILGTRRLTVDVNALQGTDEAGRAWLLSLEQEGADYLPGDYFLSDGTVPSAPLRQRVPFTVRLLSFFRGRQIAAESPTRIP